MLPFQHGGHLLKDQGSMAAVLAGSENIITYILDIVYSDYADSAGPLATPLVGRTGQATLVQNDGQFSISGGKLVIPAQATPSYGDLSLYGPTQTRAAGLAYLVEVSPTVLGNSMFGWDDGPAGGAITNETLFPTGSGVIVYNFAPLPTVYGALALSSHTLGVMLRNSGAFFFIDDDLVWVDHTKTNVSVGPGINGYLIQTTSDLWRIADLPGNATFPVPSAGIRDLDLCSPGTGNGTSSIAAPAAGNTFVHTADFKMEYDCDVLPTGGGLYVSFRIQNANDDEWRILINSVGNFGLIEMVGGGLNIRANAGGALSGGEKITICANGSTITGYYDDTLAWTYASATNYITETNGEILSLGAGPGVISNFGARTLDGVANVGSTNHPGYGLATSVLPGPRAAGDTFVHEADCRLNFLLPTIPSPGTLEYWFRSPTVGTDGWRVTVDSAGDIELDEMSGGVPTLRGSSAAAVSGGEQLRIECVDESIRVFQDTSLEISYASAASNKTATGGEIEALGTGGRISDNIAWPYDISSAPNTPGAADILNAKTIMATA